MWIGVEGWTTSINGLQRFSAPICTSHPRRFTELLQLFADYCEFHPLIHEVDLSLLRGDINSAA